MAGPHLPSAALARFAADLDPLVPASARLGLAVSGGADSLALLLLAHAARPGAVEAVTVDHRLRAESALEAATVALLCERLGVPHEVVPIDWPSGAPERNVEACARDARYDAIERWAAARSLAHVATAHHADDQVETLMMRLARGAGLSGLAGIRAARPLGAVTLVRPLLGWAKAELAWLCGEAGVSPFEDPMNADPRFDRVRVRRALAEAGFDDVAMWSASAAHLAQSEEALAYSTEHFAERCLAATAEGWAMAPDDLPDDLVRRVLLVAIDRMGERAPRGPDLKRAIATLRAGGQCVLGTVLFRVEDGRWTLSPAPPRRSL